MKQIEMKLISFDFIDNDGGYNAFLVLRGFFVDIVIFVSTPRVCWSWVLGDDPS